MRGFLLTLDTKTKQDQAGPSKWVGDPYFKAKHYKEIIISAVVVY